MTSLLLYLRLKKFEVQLINPVFLLLKKISVEEQLIEKMRKYHLLCDTND